MVDEPAVPFHHESGKGVWINADPIELETLWDDPEFDELVMKFASAGVGNPTTAGEPGAAGGSGGVIYVVKTRRVFSHLP